MIQRIRTFFQTHIEPGASADVPAHRLQLASAALLVDMMRADFKTRPEEIETARRVLQARFELSTAEVDELLQLADAEVDQSVDYHRFTGLINKAFSAEQKIRVIEMLWHVAYADDELEKYEEHMVRKVADLIHVPHRDFIAAKHRVLRELGRGF